LKSIKVKTTDLSVTVRVAYQFSFDHNFVQLTKMIDVFAIKLASTKKHIERLHLVKRHHS